MAREKKKTRENRYHTKHAHTQKERAREIKKTRYILGLGEGGVGALVALDLHK